MTANKYITKRLIFTVIQKVCVRQENESLQGNPIMITDREESLLISEIDALSLQLADALLLRREPDNVHDELAIVVLTVTAQKVGLPCASNFHNAKL